jgi:hypothetical protein
MINKLAEERTEVTLITEMGKTKKSFPRQEAKIDNKGGLFRTLF